MKARPRSRALVIACDGGARGNPGPAGIGVSIETPSGRVLESLAKAIGVATNNVAEYSAVLAGLGRARDLGATQVLVRSDSQLLVRQLRGVYRVKNPTLQRLHAEVRAAARDFERVEYEHVPRERNRRADKLVNQAIDRWEAGSRAEGAPAPPEQGDLFE